MFSIARDSQHGPKFQYTSRESSMSAFEKIIPGAFLVCVALTACGDRTEREGLAQTADGVLD